MKCFTEDCDEVGTHADLESPPIFNNPVDPKGPKVRPVKCQKHYWEMMDRRADNEASFDRIFRR